MPPHEQNPKTVVSPRSRKVRSTPVTKRGPTRHRRTRTTPNALATSSNLSSAPLQPEFDFSRVDHGLEEDPDDQVCGCCLSESTVEADLNPDGLDRGQALTTYSGRTKGSRTGDRRRQRGTRGRS